MNSQFAQQDVDVITFWSCFGTRIRVRFLFNTSVRHFNFCDLNFKQHFGGKGRKYRRFEPPKKYLIFSDLRKRGQLCWRLLILDDGKRPAAHTGSITVSQISFIKESERPYYRARCLIMDVYWEAYNKTGTQR